MSLDALCDDLIDLIGDALDARSAVAFACSFSNAPRVGIPRRNPWLLDEIHRMRPRVLPFLVETPDASRELEGRVECESIVWPLRDTHFWLVEWDGPWVSTFNE